MLYKYFILAVVALAMAVCTLWDKLARLIWRG
jgi:hypothetical protein